MSRGFNKAVIMGNLAKAADVRTAPNNQKKASITVAVERQWKDKTTGQWKTHADFINVVAWGYLADLCEKYTQKGKPVLVEGRLSVRDFLDKATGQKRWVTEVVADNIVLLGSMRDNASAQPGQGATGETGYTQAGYDEEFPLDFAGMDGGDNVGIPF